MRAYGIAHITLTVSDIHRTKRFYEELFQTKFTYDNERSFSLLSVGISCWFIQWGAPHDDRFDERRVGLDHVAFKLHTVNELHQVIEQLANMKIPNAGLERFGGKYPYVAFRDPDNIQVEFFVTT